MMVVSNFEKVDNAKVSKEAKFKEDLDLDSLDAVEIVMAIEVGVAPDVPRAYSREPLALKSSSPAGRVPTFIISTAAAAATTATAHTQPTTTTTPTPPTPPTPTTPTTRRRRDYRHRTHAAAAAPLPRLPPPHTLRHRRTRAGPSLPPVHAPYTRTPTPPPPTLPPWSSRRRSSALRSRTRRPRRFSLWQMPSSSSVPTRKQSNPSKFCHTNHLQTSSSIAMLRLAVSARLLLAASGSGFIISTS